MSPWGLTSTQFKPIFIDFQNMTGNLEIGLNGVAVSPHGLISDDDEATGCPMPLEALPTQFKAVLSSF